MSATGLAYGLRVGDVGGQLPRMLGAAIAQLPAALAVAAVAVALFGLLPRSCVAGGWTALTVAALVVLLGPTLQFSQWVQDISPFTHVPKLPGGAVSALPLTWLAGDRAGADRRRDWPACATATSADHASGPSAPQIP